MGEKTHCEDDLCIQKYNYKEYLDVVKTSNRFVDSLIAKAVRTATETKHDVKRPECTSELSNPSEIEWPTCASINIQNSQENIEKLMKIWKSVPGLEDWMYNVEFIALKADQSADYFLYEVKWSIPTPEYPIPQVTASVFFSIEASRLKSEPDLVDVTYVFEGTQFVHRPETPFQQKWLYDILDVKTLMFKSFKF